MGVAQALYTGVTGLSVNADGMSVIANNIANANARGFKRDRAEFEDLLSLSLSSGSGPAQIGRGSRLAAVKTMHTQGGLTVTDNLTDIAIQGMGFFILSHPGADAQETAGKLYTRAGSLQFDKDGYFSTASGARVQGYMANDDGVLTSRLSDIRIETNNVPPKATKTLNMNVQLDSRSDVLEAPFDVGNPVKTSNFSTSMTIFDSHGRAHQATIFFRKISASEQGVDWEWHATVDGKEVVDPGDTELKEFANGVTRFDKNGLLLEEITNESSVSFSNGAFPEQAINFDFGRNTGEEGGKGINASTSIAGKSGTIFHQQDGYEAGQLKSLEIGLDGMVTGVFTNGIEKVLSGIALATFSNQDSLLKAGKNMFYSSIESGPPNIGLPETGTRGALYSSSLEESNVDLANEFVKMITTQRMFQANSRSITTTDTMIEEVINLKR
ncbi:MAG: flagellar hook protein FlgE [Deltaproteobacteria bacterium]|nr:flagellar hook protein FlgE [Deltaproteobacteria bacterium]